MSASGSAFRVGDSVRHKRYGRGEVIAVGGGRVSVRFGEDDKTFVPEIAPLKKVVAPENTLGMTVYGTSPIKRTRRTKAEIEELDAALVEIVEQFRPVTVRQVFYQAVNHGLVPKSETKGYRVVQRRLVALRESRDIPYGSIVDGTRYVTGYTRYEDLDEFTSYAAGLYRKDYWSSRMSTSRCGSRKMHSKEC